MKAEKTKERLLSIGLDQVSVFGLSGVSLGQLAEASGLSKSGLYAHFQSKEQLQIDLLDRFVLALSRVVFEPAMAMEPGIGRLNRMIDLWLGWPARAGLSGGCPLTAALFELDDLDGAVREHVRQLEAGWRGQMAERVREAMIAGALSPRTDAEQFVWEICGIYLAHHVASRFARTGSADAYARTALAALLERHRP